MKRVVISLLSILIWFAAVPVSHCDDPAPVTTPTPTAPVNCTTFKLEGCCVQDQCAYLDNCIITGETNTTLSGCQAKPDKSFNCSDQCQATTVDVCSNNTQDDCCNKDGCGLFVNCLSLDVNKTVCVTIATANVTGCNDTCSNATIAPTSASPITSAPSEPTTDNATAAGTTNPVTTVSPVVCATLNLTLCCTQDQCAYLANCTITEDNTNKTVSGCQAKPDKSFNCSDQCLDFPTAAPTTTFTAEITTEPITGSSETTTAGKSGAECGRKFDVGSFFGGVALSAGIIIALLIGYKVYARRKENRYRQF